MSTSPFLAVKQLEQELVVMLRQIDTETLEKTEKKAVTDMKRIIVDARLDIRDYELSETREEQLKCAAEAKKRLARLEANMLLATDVFGSTDVAQLGAHIEQITGWLE